MSHPNEKVFGCVLKMDRILADRNGEQQEQRHKGEKMWHNFRKKILINGFGCSVENGMGACEELYWADISQRALNARLKTCSRIKHAGCH